MRRSRTLACTILLLVACLAHAMPSGLREVLARLPSTQRAAGLQNAATWSAMSPAQQQALRHRLAAWQAMDAGERRELRARWQAWQALPVDERNTIQSAATAFAALPMERQLALRKQFDALDGSDRRGWLLGSALGADYPRLQPLLAQVPDAQREPLLRVLRAMDPTERMDLATLAQRTPPSQRDALRKELVATPGVRRRAWLQARLAR